MGSLYDKEKYMYFGSEVIGDRQIVRVICRLSRDVVSMSITEACYLAGTGQLIGGNRNQRIEQELGLTNGIERLNIKYAVVARCTIDGRTVGYIAINRYGVEIPLIINDVLYLIGKRMLINCMMKRKEDDMIVVGKGVRLEGLPEQPTIWGRILNRNDSNVRKIVGEYIRKLEQEA